MLFLIWNPLILFLILLWDIGSIEKANKDLMLKISLLEREADYQNNTTQALLQKVIEMNETIKKLKENE
jgi:hypothetical protein